MNATASVEEFDLVVIGAGPGGYVAAVAAADAGLKTAVVEKAPVPGGVCLREGCIPSKSLLHVAKTVEEAARAKRFGVTFAPPKIDVAKIRNWKNGVIRKLSLGVKQLFEEREVAYFVGAAAFESSEMIRVEGEAPKTLRFKHCIIATGSEARALPESLLPRALCWTAAEALALEEVPNRLLVIGGGYIGLEIGQVYASLGSAVTVVEALDGILTGMDPELAQPLVSKLKKQMKAIHTSASFKGAVKTDEGVNATYVVNGEERCETFDRILVSIGRRPITQNLGLENTKVSVGENGFIQVDSHMRTTDERILAIGDVVGNPMLAHKAMSEAKVAIDVIARKPREFAPACIPGVVYTDPEVAWCGVTEAEAAEQGLDVIVTRFPWAASGRAASMSRADGLTKMICDKATKKVLGVGVVGAHAGDLIAEAVLAIEMSATAEHIASAIHPHPAMSETLMEAAEAALGKAIHGSH